MSNYRSLTGTTQHCDVARHLGMADGGFCVSWGMGLWLSIPLRQSALLSISSHLKPPIFILQAFRYIPLLSKFCLHLIFYISQQCISLLICCVCEGHVVLRCSFKMKL
jgi:hypothetical protein